MVASFLDFDLDPALMRAALVTVPAVPRDTGERIEEESADGTGVDMRLLETLVLKSVKRLRRSRLSGRRTDRALLFISELPSLEFEVMEIFFRHKMTDMLWAAQLETKEVVQARANRPALADDSGLVAAILVGAVGLLTEPVDRRRGAADAAGRRPSYCFLLQSLGLRAYTEDFALVATRIAQRTAGEIIRKTQKLRTARRAARLRRALRRRRLPRAAARRP